ncbi:TlpA family protein disulfide reductase [Chitinophaga lutea]|uniref:TlpA family protein disulfide reductase n=1 Tax=Chitinophaga lutea TaxID=2488634 RepID=A0A3N4Q3N4_9BACT|nr:TlpA disulfide reductase family protein [Chitinophaga lutea]RPE14185.1 TlpA family protein disulfide reductase [Chitinophaga lutea]
MKRIIIACIILLGITTARAQVTISPEFPERGQTVTVSYAPAAPVKGPVTLMFSYSNFYDLAWKMPMEPQGNQWTTSFKLADFATFATFYLQAGDSVIRPGAGKHYEVAVYNNKVPVENGLLYKGYSLSAQMGKSPLLAARQAEQYAAELQRYPDNYEAKLRLLQYRISTATGAEKETLRAQAHKVIADKFYAAPTVPGNMNKVTMGYLIIGENSRLDSIRQVVRERYPESDMGRDLWTAYIAKGKDTAKQIDLFLAALKKETAENAGAFSAMHDKLFDYYAARKNGAKAVLHARKVAANDKSPYYPNTLKNIAQTLLDNQLMPDTARAYAARALAMADKFPAGVIRFFPETGYIYPHVDDSTRKAVTAKAKGNLLSMLGLIDMQQGRMKDADARMTEAMQISGDKETLDNVAVFFNKTNNRVRLQELQALREKAMLEKVAKMRAPRPAPVMQFTDLKGKPVDPASLKNKVVVIDFWATWCIPCMEEMPYLQKVYNQYRDRKDVVFMVVNSGARNTLADAQGWSGNKKYTFPVYYNTDPEAGDKFKFNIIPATYLIGKDGNIQFSNIGFEGPEVETKLKLQIEMLLKN